MVAWIMIPSLTTTKSGIMFQRRYYFQHSTVARGTVIRSFRSLTESPGTSPKVTVLGHMVLDPWRMYVFHARIEYRGDCERLSNLRWLVSSGL